MRQLFIITGASGGFGSAILRQINAAFGENALIIASGRNHAKISDTTSNFTAEVRKISVDFGKREEIRSRCQEIMKLGDGESFDHVTLFNNHGSMNEVDKLLAESDDAVKFDDYMFLNVTSFQILTCVFLNHFPAIKHTCVNISSICALQAFPSMGMYCTSKAARHMIYRCIAKENPDVNVLNYSPGPMDTSMTQYITQTTVDASIKQMFSDLSAQGRWVDVDESAKKMLTILKDGSYEQGQHVDFFDRS